MTRTPIHFRVQKIIQPKFFDRRTRNARRGARRFKLVDGFGLMIQDFSEVPLTSQACQRLFLRVVQTKTILFLKSMSESVGSDIERCN